MWTPATRRQHSRNALRYQMDLTPLSSLAAQYSHLSGEEQKGGA